MMQKLRDIAFHCSVWYIVATGTINTLSATPHGSSAPAFSQHFLHAAIPEHPISAHHHHPVSAPTTIPQSPQKLLDRNTINQAISLATLLYAGIRIAYRARQTHYNQQHHYLLQRVIASCLPNFVITVYKHQKLILISLETTLEALVIKFVAQCLVACAYDSLPHLLCNQLLAFLHAINPLRKTTISHLETGKICAKLV